MSHSDSSLEIKQAPPRHLIPNYHNSGGVEEQTRVNTYSTGGLLERKEFLDYANELRRIVEKRAENAQLWVRELHSFIDEHRKDNVDWKQTFANIDRVGERIAKGEYLATYRGDYNSEFAPRKVVTLFGGILGPLAESLRPVSRLHPLHSLFVPILDFERSNAVQQRVMPYFMSDYASKQSQGEPLASGEFQAAIRTIAEHYSFYQSGGSGNMLLKEHSVELSKEAETWCRDVSSVYKKSRGKVRRVADSSRLNEPCKKLRWNLLVTATYVCSGQLPTAERVVHGDYDGILSSPPNVEVPGQGFVPHSASHSLARISRRYAPLIGYNGPEARQGGLEFI